MTNLTKLTTRERIEELEDNLSLIRTLVDFVCTCEASQAHVALGNLKMWLRQNPEVKENDND